MGSAPYFAYGAVGLTGSGDATLESISSVGLLHKDIALALDDNKVCFYKFNTASNKTHEPPYAIKPYNEPTESPKIWELISQEVFTTDIIQQAENYIYTGGIKALDNEKIILESHDGKTMKINFDGSVEFPSTISASDPSELEHLTTKNYVDSEITTKEQNLESYVDNEINNIKSDLESYVDNEFLSKENSLENYVDNELINKENSLETYIDGEISSKENELKSYSDSEINRVVENVFPILKFNITSWLMSGNYYYKDIQHNKGFNYLIINCWNEFNEVVWPSKIEAIDNNTTRIWMIENINLTVCIL